MRPPSVGKSSVAGIYSSATNDAEFAVREGDGSNCSSAASHSASPRSWSERVHVNAVDHAVVPSITLAKARYGRPRRWRRVRLLQDVEGQVLGCLSESSSARSGSSVDTVVSLRAFLRVRLERHPFFFFSPADLCLDFLLVRRLLDVRGDRRQSPSASVESRCRRT
mmetsp:Transcript_604/g.2131  ORF Transcript_604/g.2131 Transcript_604/m.2131 type:complete len:166 (+) Transcript_604:953-1450(+)